MERDSQARHEQEGRSAAGEGFNATYSGIAHSVTLRRVQREVYGEEYPDEVEPFSFVTRSDLHRIARELGVGAGQNIVDLACGEGGASLWMVRETGAHVTGVDVSSVAVTRAQGRIAAAGLEDKARFRVGDFAATGLPAESFDGAMSIDALWVVPEKTSALREVARILRPGARFIVTTWDFGISPSNEPQIADHRPLLRDAGFTVEAYDGTDNWEGYARALVAGYQAARDDLAAEFGAAAAEKTIAHYQRRAALLPQWQRIFVIARRS